MNALADPTGTYNIDLSNAFDRAVILDALDAVAMHQSLVISEYLFDYAAAEDDKQSASNWESIELHKFNELRSTAFFDHHEMTEIDSLLKLRASLTSPILLQSIRAKFQVSEMNVERNNGMHACVLSYDSAQMLN